MKIIIGQSPYGTNNGHGPLKVNINQLINYKKIFDSVDSDITVAFIPEFTDKSMNPDRIDTFRRIMSLLLGKKEAKRKIIEINNSLQNIGDGESNNISKDLAVFFDEKEVILLNTFEDKKCRQENILVQKCFEYVKQHSEECQMLLLGSKAIEVWERWKKANNCDYSAFKYPHPSRVSGYNKSWNAIDYKKIELATYSKRHDIETFQLD